MTVIIGEQSTSTGQAAPYYKRQIRCPGHWLIPPQVDAYLREPVPLLKDCKDSVEFKGRLIKIKKTRIARDRWGNKRLDWKKLYKLRDKGIVLNPVVSAAWAIEHVYDPQGSLCLNCPKWCKEGMGRINELSIRRLHGWQKSSR